MKTLTKKQSAFRDAILGGFSPSEAYRKAFEPKSMSKKAIANEAQKLLKHRKITLAITLAVNDGKVSALGPPLTPAVRMSMEERLEELRCAARLDPADIFDDLNHVRSIREMPEHVRRAIAGFEVDPVSFVTKIKFVDKRGAIMDYSRLAGDIPREASLPPPPREINPALREMSVAQRLALKAKIERLIAEAVEENKVVTPHPNGSTNSSAA